MSAVSTPTPTMLASKRTIACGPVGGACSIRSRRADSIASICSRTRVNRAKSRRNSSSVFGGIGWSPGARSPQRHYVPVEGNRGRKRSGAYLGYYDDGVPNGIIWNYKAGARTKWKATGEYVPLSADESAALAAQAEATRAAREAERAGREARRRRPRSA